MHSIHPAAFSICFNGYHHLATRAAKLEKMTLERAGPGNDWKRDKNTQTFAYLFSLDSMLLEYLYKVQHQAAL